MEQELISDMIKLGCKDRTNANLTYQVYVDLIEIKKFFDVKYHYSRIFNALYVTARETKNDIINTYFPISATDSISINKMEEIMSLSTSQPKALYLAMVSSDSTCVYYKITDGILPVSEINLEGPRFELREKHNKTLFKNKEILRQSAYLHKPLSELLSEGRTEDT